jgi:hypothetical protein
MTKSLDTGVFITKPIDYVDWQLYMFGSTPDKPGMVYRPGIGYEPSWFVRWMMKVCFDCLWAKKKQND